MARSNLNVSGIEIANDKPFVLFGGMNVLESRELAFEVAEKYVDVCSRLGTPYVFKASSTRPTARPSTPSGAPASRRGCRFWQISKANSACPSSLTCTNRSRRRLQLKSATSSSYPHS